MINDIIFGVLVFLLVMCIISAVTEIIPSKRKKTFNFFRFIRINMRELSLTAVIFFSVVIIAVNLISKNNVNMMCVEILVLFLCYLTVHGERIFNTLRRLKKKSKKKRLPVRDLKDKLLKKLPQTGFIPVLPLKTELKAK